jgi:hypothetical protein
MSTSPTELTIHLLYRTLPDLPPDEGPVTIGIQDKNQDVHAGQRGSDGWRFTCTLTVKGKDADGKPVFAGPFMHGTVGARFIYLSWKRVIPAPALWYQRVKIPLAGITWDMAQAGALDADISARRPYASEPIAWMKRRT